MQVLRNDQFFLGVGEFRLVDQPLCFVKLGLDNLFSFSTGPRSSFASLFAGLSLSASSASFIASSKFALPGEVLGVLQFCAASCACLPPWPRHPPYPLTA